MIRFYDFLIRGLFRLNQKQGNEGPLLNAFINLQFALLLFMWCSIGIVLLQLVLPNNSTSFKINEQNYIYLIISCLVVSFFISKVRPKNKILKVYKNKKGYRISGILIFIIVSVISLVTLLFVLVSRHS